MFNEFINNKVKVIISSKTGTGEMPFNLYVIGALVSEDDKYIKLVDAIVSAESWYKVAMLKINESNYDTMVINKDNIIAICFNK